MSELQKLFSQYPEASTRCGLADLGDLHERTRVYELACVELGGFTMCEIKERPQQGRVGWRGVTAPGLRPGSIEDRVRSV